MLSSPRWWKAVYSPDNGSRNRLLAALSAAGRALLLPSLEAVVLGLRQIIEAPNRPISHVCFIETGLASVVAASGSAHRIEVGMLGQEGMTGLGIVLGDDRSANETWCNPPDRRCASPRRRCARPWR